MAIGLRCTADFQTTNHPNCSFPFPFFQRLATGRQLAMSSPWSQCDVLSFKQRSHRGLRNAQIRTFAVPEVWLPTKRLLRFLNPILGLCRGLHAGKAIRPYLYSHFQTSGALGLPMCHIFSSIGKLTTRSDFHRTEIWPDNSASRGHGIWHEGVPTHGRPWMAAINLWQFYPVSLIGLPMPLFQSHGKPNSPILLRDLEDRPDKIASNGVCSDYENSSSDCHLHEWNLVARWYQGNFFPILQTSLLRAAESVLPNRVNFCQLLLGLAFFQNTVRRKRRMMIKSAAFLRGLRESFPTRRSSLR